LDTLLQAIEKAGYKPGDDVMIALIVLLQNSTKMESMITENSRLRMPLSLQAASRFLI
jgi:enolase